MDILTVNLVCTGAVRVRGGTRLFQNLGYGYVNIQA